jgi:D-aminopeptidase
MSKSKKKLRARELGIIFEGNTGRYNAITDVDGVKVGHTTIIKGKGQLIVEKGPIRTGVTAILTRENVFDPVFAGWAYLNGNGEMTGTIWVEESGFLQGPVMITNTHSVGVVHDAVIEWMNNQTKDTKTGNPWALPVVAETYDGYLNDINGFHVKKKHAFEALDKSATGSVEEGNVGGGTGMICHQFKGGIGTSSRVVTLNKIEYKVGVLVQANYGMRPLLTVSGVPVGKEITDLLPEENPRETRVSEQGSIIVVIATDAPLLPHQIKRLARRAPLGIAKVGGIGGNGSGDIFIAFSTANKNTYSDNEVTEVKMLPNVLMTDLFRAVVQATEEAIINALVAAKTMIGINGNIVYALPHDRLVEALKRYNRQDS